MESMSEERTESPSSWNSLKEKDNDLGKTYSTRSFCPSSLVALASACLLSMLLSLVISPPLPSESLLATSIMLEDVWMLLVAEARQIWEFRDRTM